MLLDQGNTRCYSKKAEMESKGEKKDLGRSRAKMRSLGEIEDEQRSELQSGKLLWRVNLFKKRVKLRDFGNNGKPGFNNDNCQCKTKLAKCVGQK